jgi:hypothetical protein
MTTTYRRTNTDSGLTGGQDFNKAVLFPANDTTGSQSISLGNQETRTSRAFTDVGVPGTAGVTGTYTVEQETLVGNTNVVLAVTLHRVNSAGTIQTSSALSAEQTATAGTKTFTFTNLSLGTWAAGDRLRIDYRYRNAAHGSQNFTVTHGGTNNEVVAPWTLAAPINITPAGMIVANATSSPTVTQKHSIAPAGMVVANATSDSSAIVEQPTYTASEWTSYLEATTVVEPISNVIVKYDWESGVQDWADVPGTSTVTHETTAPITGSGSLRVAYNGGGASSQVADIWRSVETAADWSADGDVLTCKVKLLSGPEVNARIDVWDGTVWNEGQLHPLVLNEVVTVEHDTSLTAASTAFIRRLRIIVFYGATAGTHLVDDFGVLSEVTPPDTIAPDDLTVLNVTSDSSASPPVVVQPPDGWESFTPLDVSAGGDFVLLNNTNYLIQNQSVTGSHVRLRGGRKVVVMGLTVTINQEWSTFQSGSEMYSTGLELQENPYVDPDPLAGGPLQADAEFYIQDFHATGPRLTQGMRVNCLRDVKIKDMTVDAITFKNCDHRDGTNGLTTNHPDVIQTYNEGFKSLTIDGLVGQTGYQGLFIRGHLAVDKNRPVYLKNIHIKAIEFASQEEDSSSYNYAGMRLLSNIDEFYPFTVGDNVWIEGHPNNGWGPPTGTFQKVRYWSGSSYTLDPVGGTAEHIHAIDPTIVASTGTDGIGDYAELTNSGGKVYLGAPPVESIAPDSMVVANATSTSNVSDTIYTASEWTSYLEATTAAGAINLGSPDSMVVANATSDSNLTQKHTISSDSAASVTDISVPTLSQEAELGSDDQVAVTAVTEPTLVQASQAAPDSLTVVSVASSPTVTQAHSAAPSSLSVDAVVSEPTVSQDHVTSPDDSVSLTDVSVPTLSQAGELGSDDHVAVTDVTVSQLTQAHSLAPASLTVASVTSASSLIEDYQLASNSHVAATDISVPTLTQAHSLTSASLVSITDISVPTISQAGELGADDHVAITTASSPTFVQDHSITVASATVDSTVGSPTFTVVSYLSPNALTVASVESAPTTSVASSLSPDSLTVANVTESPTINTTVQAQWQHEFDTLITWDSTWQNRSSLAQPNYRNDTNVMRVTLDTLHSGNYYGLGGYKGFNNLPGVDSELAEGYFQYKAYFPVGSPIDGTATGGDTKTSGIGGGSSAAQSVNSSGGTMLSDAWSVRIQNRVTRSSWWGTTMGHPFAELYMYVHHVNGELFSSGTRQNAGWGHIYYLRDVEGSGNPLPLPIGQWVEFKIYWKQNTPGLNDGVLKCWMNDVLAANLTDVRFCTAEYGAVALHPSIFTNSVSGSYVDMERWAITDDGVDPWTTSSLTPDSIVVNNVTSNSVVSDTIYAASEWTSYLEATTSSVLAPDSIVVNNVTSNSNTITDTQLSVNNLDVFNVTSDSGVFVPGSTTYGIGSPVASITVYEVIDYLYTDYLGITTTATSPILTQSHVDLGNPNTVIVEPFTSSSTLQPPVVTEVGVSPGYPKIDDAPARVRVDLTPVVAVVLDPITANTLRVDTQQVTSVSIWTFADNTVKLDDQPNNVRIDT